MVSRTLLISLITYISPWLPAVSGSVLDFFYEGSLKDFEPGRGV